MTHRGSAGSDARRQRTVARFLLMEEDRVVIYPSRTKALLLFVGSIVFVVLGVWIGSPWMADQVVMWKRVAAAYVGVPFFGLCGAYIGHRLLRRRPAFVADRSGITDSASATSVGHVPWSEIACVVPYRFNGQAMLGIWPRDLDVLARRQGAVRRFLMKLNVRLGAAPANIPEAILPVTVEELAGILHSRFGDRVEINL